MKYPAAMIQLLKCDPSGIRQLPVNHLPWICICHVSLLGLIYGSTAAFLSRDLLAGQGLLKLIFAGIPVAFLMHAGAALFIWVFLKALGGNAAFLNAYFTIGVAAISLCPLAPFLAILQTQAFSPLILTGTTIAGLYGLAVNAKMIQDVFNLSFARMVIALSVAIVYIGCFLYLWV
ncbi:MAG: hypothetical protein V2J08_06205 [Desulfotignum sp.]|jgi:hypothetical protein|nr:hypothetical protein [Desulfotignum sp.]